MNVREEYKDYTREMLVEEYLETRLATLVEVLGTEHRWMPVDINKNVEYWKSKNKDLHDMHIEIARRYGIKREDCLWLEEIVDTDNFYVVNYKFKAIVRHALKLLEKAEKEKNSESEK